MSRVLCHFRNGITERYMSFSIHCSPPQSKQKKTMWFVTHTETKTETEGLGFKFENHINWNWHVFETNPSQCFLKKVNFHDNQEIFSIFLTCFPNDLLHWAVSEKHAFPLITNLERLCPDSAFPPLSCLLRAQLSHSSSGSCWQESQCKVCRPLVSKYQACNAAPTES